MDLLKNIYQTSLIENEGHLRFWEDYLQRLMALDFNVFADKLKVPALVPIGNRVLFRGEIQHTNEVTVALGSDYFAKCSIKQAEVLRQHRIKDAKTKLESFKKEREYLENQLFFGKRSTIEDQGQDIIEHYTEEEDKLWREKHRENMRAYKQRKDKDDDIKTDVTDEELWNRLEELELQEDLNNEQSLVEDSQAIDNISENPEPFVLEEETNHSPVTNTEEKPKTIVKKKVTFTDVEEDRSSQIRSKLDLLQKVLEKQHEIERQLQELKAKERSQSLTENDLLSKLDEMEQLDELEDEMDRLEDVIENENVEVDNNANDSDDDHQETVQTPSIQKKKGVMFADEIDSDDDPETIDINFKHSDNDPTVELFDSNKGIQNPSDVYEACSHLFKETKSILKKSKYPDTGINYNYIEPIKKQSSVILEEDEEEEECPEENRTIVVKDVLENIDQSESVKVEESKARPTSLFKMKRQQQKKS